MKLEHFFEHFKPENYQLKLEIDRIGRRFQGAVVITGQVKNPSGIIKLHANYLTIKSIKTGDQTVEFSYYDNILELVNPDSQPITIRYSGQITDQMNGIYPCYYQLDGQPRELIASQFESHYLREVMPCVDEPIAKATFDLTLVTETGVTALSNMPVAEQQQVDGQLHTTFATTPLMSGYTLGFVVGELISKTATTASGVQTTVYATPAHQPEALDFALNVAVKSIDFYEQFLGVKYPLPKCDHIALPDFAAGAMENWGLVTYREALLLADNTTAVSSKKQIASVIAHELAHMWFGNLVTMKWWDELWLNESLATLLEHFAVEAIHPEYQIWHDFYSFNYQYAQSRDALPGVQPILTPIEHPDEISTIFDGAIVYAKGACVMLMLEKWLGQAQFAQALGQFLTQFAYQNPTTDDFLDTFEQISGKPVVDFMQKWLHQSGFPIVELRNQTISQRQFGYDSPQTWPIPLGIEATSANLPEVLWQAEASANQQLCLINRDIVGFMVTNYDEARKNHLRQRLMTGELSALDQFYYLSNQLLLAKHNYIASAELVDDFQSFQDKEHDLLVWNNLAKIIGSLRFFVEATATEKNLKHLVAQSAKSQAEQLGFTAQATDTPEQLELRALLVSQLAYAEDPTTVDWLIQQFNDHYPGRLAELSPDLRSVILSAKLKYDFTEDVFEALVQQYQTTHNPDFKDDLRVALTSVRELSAGQHLIDLLNDKTVVKNQDLSAWFVMILRNRQLKNLAWQWLKANFAQLRQTFSENKDYADFARYAGAVLYTAQDLIEYEQLFTPYHDDLALARTIEVGLSEIKLRHQLYQRDAQGVIEALTKTEL
jgi:membrane alanyl aminopeptidase